MNKQEAIEFLVKQDVELAEATRLLHSVDMEQLTKDAEGGSEMELWDRHKPINGVPAAEVLKNRADIPKKGEVILIKFNDKVRYFQPHMPNEPGFRAMTKDVAMAVGTEMLNKLRAEYIQHKLLALVGAVAPSD